MKTTEVECKECCKVFLKADVEIRKSKTGNHFCSRSCAASYNNKIYKKRSKGAKPCVILDDKTYICTKCKQRLPSMCFYYLKSKNKPWLYCKQCESARKKKQVYNFKQLCLKYKNQSCCYKCGYNRNIKALDFHHRDPKEKQFGIAEIRALTLSDIVKQELDKCVVICANCHREEH